MHLIITDSATVILAVATIVLAWATIKLYQHTQVLSSLTKRLVSIEDQRDKRDEQLLRRADLTIALNTIEELIKIDPNQFGTYLERPKGIPEPANSLLRKLHNYIKYINDPESKLYIIHLIQVIDSVQRGSSIGDNRIELEREFKQIQERMNWSINEWREELAH